MDSDGEETRWVSTHLLSRTTSASDQERVEEQRVLVRKGKKTKMSMSGGETGTSEIFNFDETP